MNSQDEYDQLLALIELALPSIPDKDVARCHVNITSHLECAYCSRIRAAHEALNVLKKAEITPNEFEEDSDVRQK